MTLLRAGSGARSAQRTRRHAPRSLAAEVLRRALQRQWLPFALTALALGALAWLVFRVSEIGSLKAALIAAATILVSALIFAIVRELHRKALTSPKHLRARGGYTLLGTAPELSAGDLRALPPDLRHPQGCLTTMPAAPFSAAFRDLQAQFADHSVVAFIALAEDDGATTAALCSAISAVLQHRRVIAVDCDMRRRALTRALAGDPHGGLLAACSDPASWRERIERDEETGLDFLAAPPGNPWRLLAAEPGLDKVIACLREAYECVVLDCPPATTDEGFGLARMADRCVVVAGWDRAPRPLLQHTVQRLLAATRRAPGVFVNRAPPAFRLARPQPE